MATRGSIGGLCPSPHSFIDISERPFLVGRPLRLQCLPISRGADQKHNVIVSRRLFGLEEAMRVRRSREGEESVKVRKRPPLKRGRVSGPLLVPDHIPRPPYVGSEVLPELSSEHQVHDEEGISRMRAACELAARVLDFAGTLVRPTITTNEIDKAVHKMIIDAGAYPSPLGYGGFPKSVCTSVNECMCHGIPDSRRLQDGDIINIDVTVYLNTSYVGLLSADLRKMEQKSTEGNLDGHGGKS